MNVDPPRSSGRADTESKLQGATMALLQRNGVLAGLNLREVADEARVNRALVYQYFGSRRQLLRASLHRASRQLILDLKLNNQLPFKERWHTLFRMLRERSEVVQLLALLVLDGDEIRTMPLRSETRDVLASEAREGPLPADTDVEALHAVLLSSAWGYALFRRSLAREFDLDPKVLDERADAVIERILTGLAS